MAQKSFKVLGYHLTENYEVKERMGIKKFSSNLSKQVDFLVITWILIAFDDKDEGCLCVYCAYDVGAGSIVRVISFAFIFA